MPEVYAMKTSRFRTEHPDRLRDLAARIVCADGSRPELREHGDGSFSMRASAVMLTLESRRFPPRPGRYHVQRIYDALQALLGPEEYVLIQEITPREPLDLAVVTVVTRKAVRIIDPVHKARLAAERLLRPLEGTA